MIPVFLNTLMVPGINVVLPKLFCGTITLQFFAYCPSGELTKVEMSGLLHAGDEDHSRICKPGVDVACPANLDCIEYMPQT